MMAKIKPVLTPTRMMPFMASKLLRSCHLSCSVMSPKPRVEKVTFRVLLQPDVRGHFGQSEPQNHKSAAQFGNVAILGQLSRRRVSLELRSDLPRGHFRQKT